METYRPQQQWVRDRADEFRVSLQAYQGDEIFQAEMEWIFHASWIYLCHESEIEAPGDFKSTLIGRQPVVVTRDASRAIHAFINFCPHRGALLVREEYGNSRALVCPYHGWTFRLSGELAAVTSRERYPASFSLEDKGLIRLAQVRNYGGLVFGSLRPTMSLEDFLGDARPYLDRFLARTAGGRYKVARPHRYKYRGNWKFQSENVVDGYHPMFVHRSALNTYKRHDLLGRRVADGKSGVRDGGQTRGFPQGHALLGAGSARDLVFVSEQEQQAYKDRIARHHGREQVDEILSNQHLLIFPNLALMDLNIRVIQPISAESTDVYSYPLLIDGESDALNSARLQELQMRLGTAGMVQTDDIDIFGRNQAALRIRPAPSLLLSRGLESEQLLPSGERVGEYSDETPQRAFWRRWQQIMEAQS